ncbi:hypothetical protein GH714_031001 [Hevea brasiliensis]|uniref:F-box associated beta-propeller type 1 domain-containing protein n=1 Tax=Hevea brasiliensis TaxID=3981 RepID=A0A6A6K8K0_HEVBR|nr:hypothetical protein GH714_031001 [Hevea brasiliensis]
MAANNTNPCLILHGDHPIQSQLYALYFYPNNSNVGLVKRISLPPIPDFDIAPLAMPNLEELRTDTYNLVQSPAQIMVNGKLHWANSPFIHPRGNNRLISFDLADEKFRMVPIPDSAGFERHGYHRLKLVTIGGCLSVVLNINYGSFEIWVMKEYGVRQSWTKEFNISSDLPRELEEEEKLILPLKFQECIEGMPNMFEAVAHDGNLNGIDSLLIGM